MQITRASQKSLSALGAHLMNLRAAEGGDLSYIEKNLEDFFDIQIYSTIYFGSDK